MGRIRQTWHNHITDVAVWHVAPEDRLRLGDGLQASTISERTRTDGITLSDAADSEITQDFLADVRWQTGTVAFGAGETTETSDILRDANNAIKAGDAIGNHNCSGTWSDYLSVSVPDASWLGGVNYPYDSNIYIHDRAVAGCGHCVFSNLFPLYVDTPIYWGFTYDEIAVGTGSYRGDHPHCFHPFSSPGTRALEGVHGGWDNMGSYSNCGRNAQISIECPSFGAVATFLGKTSINGSRIELVGSKWFRHQVIVGWNSTTQFQIHKRILEIPADGGDLIIDVGNWFQRDNGGAQLLGWYNASSSNRSTRSASTVNVNQIRDITFGNGQSGQGSGTMLVGVAGFRAKMVTSFTDWVPGLT